MDRVREVEQPHTGSRWLRAQRVAMVVLATVVAWTSLVPVTDPVVAGGRR